MTCSRVFYGLLAALFGYVVVTVAAFRYLEWWQAILASAVTLGLIVSGGKLLVRAAVGRLGSMVQGLVVQHSRSLKDATVDVHSVSPAPPAAATDDEAPRDLRWFAFDLSVFPARELAGPADEWHPGTLTLVPASAKPPRPFGGFAASGIDESVELHDLQVVADGEAEPAGGAVSGPQRLRFVAGVPTRLKELSLRYVVHQFGHIRLPAAALPGRP